MDKPHSKFVHVYAIVRFDFPMDAANPENTVAVVKVFESKALAEAEASRLNRINENKRCTYRVCTSRLMPNDLQ